VGAVPGRKNGIDGSRWDRLGGQLLTWPDEDKQDQDIKGLMGSMHRIAFFTTDVPRKKPIIEQIMRMAGSNWEFLLGCVKTCAEDTLKRK
jgi:hypothetical protein